MGQARDMHKHAGAELLHELCTPGRGCGFLQQDCGAFQDTTFLSGMSIPLPTSLLCQILPLTSYSSSSPPHPSSPLQLQPTPQPRSSPRSAPLAALTSPSNAPTPTNSTKYGTSTTSRAPSKQAPSSPPIPTARNQTALPQALNTSPRPAVVALPPRLPLAQLQLGQAHPEHRSRVEVRCR